MKYTYLIAISLLAFSTSGSCSQPEAGNAITVSAHHMTRPEIQELFGTRGRKLGYYGLCPIQLTIENNSADVIIFDPEKTTVAFADHQRVAACLQYHTVLAGAGIIVLGLVAAGTIITFTLSSILWFYLTGIVGTTMSVGLAATGGMLILTPTTAVYYVDYARSANAQIAQKAASLVADHAYRIPAGQKVEAILFVNKSECKKEFEVTLVNEATQEPIVIEV